MSSFWPWCCNSPRVFAASSFVLSAVCASTHRIDNWPVSTIRLLGQYLETQAPAAWAVLSLTSAQSTNIESCLCAFMMNQMLITSCLRQFIEQRCGFQLSEFWDIDRVRPSELSEQTVSFHDGFALPCRPSRPPPLCRNLRTDAHSRWGMPSQQYGKQCCNERNVDFTVSRCRNSSECHAQFQRNLCGEL